MQWFGEIAYVRVAFVLVAEADNSAAQLQAFDAGDYSDPGLPGVAVGDGAVVVGLSRAIRARMVDRAGVGSVHRPPHDATPNRARHFGARSSNGRHLITVSPPVSTKPFASQSVQRARSLAIQFLDSCCCNSVSVLRIFVQSAWRRRASPQLPQGSSVPFGCLRQ